MPKKYEILVKRDLSPDTTLISVYAPLIAKKAKAGQFIILRVSPDGERIPLTVSSCTDEAVTVVFQKIGATTMELGLKNEGDCLQDFVGPLGVPTEIEGCRKAVVVGGGLGCAIALPVARALYEAGVEVDLVAGFKTKDIIILEEEMKKSCTRLHICTDDGSYGYAGFTTGKLEDLLKEGGYDRAYAIGPLVMMKFCCNVTEKYDVPTIISMNPIMIDGTGMCGCCRVTVGGEVKFACVDGPDFDGHLVDFDETIARAATYKEFETKRKEEHVCRLRGAK